MQYFKGNPAVTVALLICNRKEAKAFDRAAENGVRSIYISKIMFSTQPEEVIKVLGENQIDFIVLAGFLLLIPAYLLQMFPNRILNIHPALLPAFGGAGMFGQRIHEEVQSSGVSHTGLSIHEVDAHFDTGKIIFQARCPVYTTDTAIDIAARVLELEHKLYPFVIEQFIQSKTEIRSKKNV